MKTTKFMNSALKAAFLLYFNSLFLVKMVTAQCPKIVWADEFDGSILDLTKWSYQVGDGCDINLCNWGNNELQWYAQDNAVVSDGTLKIIAKRQTVGTKSYTSARIRTISKADIKYGRIEARMKMPIGQGIWPAFWMLPTDNVYGVWPQSGEIDIMEYLGHEPNTIFGTLHYGNPWPNNSFTTKTFTLTEGGFNQDFHNYALEWTENDIKWFIDGYLYSTKTRNDLGGSRWPFDQKFHFLLNMAIGGNLPGSPNSSTIFPQTFEVDYVRVYDLTGAPYLTGNQKVAFMAKGSAYSIANFPAGSTINWTVPAGATIASGNGTKDITVNWGSVGGKITATVTNSCGESKYELNVQVAPNLTTAVVLENFDLDGKITRTSSTGVFTDNVANPAPNAVNGSALCGKYVRNSGQQYDVLFYDVADVTNAADFVTGEKKFYIDINTNAPVGTTILLQLENKTLAQAANYPTGRHSRYSVVTTKQNEWERLSFTYLDRPDGAVSSQGVNQMVVLFAPNGFTGSTFYFDNFEIYAKSTLAAKDIDNSRIVKISPNPTSDILNIEAEHNHLLEQIEIIDALGKSHFSVKNIGKTATTISLPQLSSGVYYLNITFNDTKKVIKAFVKN